MENILIEFEQKILGLKGLIDRLGKFLGETPVSKQVREGVERFNKNISAYGKAVELNDAELIAQSAKNIAVYAQLTAQGVSGLQGANDETINMGLELLEKAAQFRTLVETSTIDYKSLNFERESSIDSGLFPFTTNFAEIPNEQLEHDRRIKKLLAESEARVGVLSNRINKIEKDSEFEVQKISKKYETTILELEDKEKQINDILGHVAGRAIAGDYETSASNENTMANRLRYASLACMGVIVIVVGFSFWESTSEFQWQNSVFRIILAIMLSVPAAYLARESAKHREQQYNHLQTSLDLKALSPYIASLPEQEQHKLKVEIAGRLFAAKDFSKVGTDPYPINMHEFVMEIIKKLELKSSPSDEEKDSK